MPFAMSDAVPTVCDLWGSSVGATVADLDLGPKQDDPDQIRPTWSLGPKQDDPDQIRSGWADAWAA